MIPLTFLIGFYVSEVVRRYWDQYTSLPYPDRLALKLVSYVPGKVSNKFYLEYLYYMIILEFKNFLYHKFRTPFV